MTGSSAIFWSEKQNYFGKKMWTRKGLVCAHKMVINILSEVGCEQLQDMPTALHFAFDNLQNRACLFITNSVILHLAREGNWRSFIYWVSLPDTRSRSPTFLSGGLSGMLLMCLKPNHPANYYCWCLLDLLFVFLMRTVNIAHFIHI